MIVLSYLSRNSPRDLSEQLAESENYLNVIVNIIWVSTSNNEKASTVGLLDNLPITDKKATNILKKINLIPILVSVLDDLSTKTLSPACSLLVENVVGVLIRFTLPTEKKLRKFSVEQGVVSCLVKILSSGSPVAKSRAATNLAQLSQSSFSLSKPKTSRWLCLFPCCELCEVHDGNCSVETTFCLLNADAVTPLEKFLVSEERDCDEAVLGALTTLMQDEIWERGSHVIAKASGLEAVIRVLQVGNIKAQEKALWILERVFRVESHRIQYGEFAQGVLVDPTQKGSPTLKSSVAKILAHLELLQILSCVMPKLISSNQGALHKGSELVKILVGSGDGDLNKKKITSSGKNSLAERTVPVLTRSIQEKMAAIKLLVLEEFLHIVQAISCTLYRHVSLHIVQEICKTSSQWGMMYPAETPEGHSSSTAKGIMLYIKGNDLSSLGICRFGFWASSDCNDSISHGTFRGKVHSQWSHLPRFIMYPM
ncbi:hypothetical protein GIB67_003401 [Kingdonia uniflora]|uniref:Uncharacterized protein n=1 Tax=Kingdonia uniflora TaxID=39325 RepID=A0A7J7P998_9MAGN|nr:hypothetical protein GIB67_003401 [Kingdonia uniflora]